MATPFVFALPAGLHRTTQILELQRTFAASGCPVRLTAYDTVQGCSWNGGRLIWDRSFRPDPTQHWHRTLNSGDLKQALARAQELNAAGIPFNLTFNSTLSSIDLEDPVGNALLEGLHHELNSVTVATEVLRSHVKQNFPKYQLTASICHAQDRIEGCLPLFERYDQVVMMPVFAYELDELRSLPTERMSFILNDSCWLFCSRKEHYDHISRCHLSGNTGYEEQRRNAQRDHCFLRDRVMEPRMLKGADKTRITRINQLREQHMRQEGLPLEFVSEANHPQRFNITPVARRGLFQAGVRHFKLQGRNEGDEVYQALVIDFLKDIVAREIEPGLS